MTRKNRHEIPADFAQRAPRMTIHEIAREWHIGRPKARQWLERIGDHRENREQKAMPDGFAEVMNKLGSGTLEKRFGLTRHEVARMRKECGYVPREARKRIDMPESFASVAGKMTTGALADRFGVSDALIRDWRSRLGINPPTPRYHRDGSSTVRGPTARSIHDLAADHLRRTAPVHRCKSDGRFDLRGDHWRYGNVILDRDELIARAQRKGWRADAWREIEQPAGGGAHP